MKILRRLYLSNFPAYKILETKFVSYSVADKMLSETYSLPENERWVLAPEEDRNMAFGYVFLCRKERILE